MINPIPDRNDQDDPRWREFGTYVRMIADAMGLGQWYFVLSQDPPEKASNEDEVCTAQVFISSQSVKVIYCVGDTFWTKTPYEQRWSVVHELLHVIEAPYINAIRTGCDAPASVMSVINQLRERFIDQVALMLAPQFKLPPESFMPEHDEEG